MRKKFIDTRMTKLRTIQYQSFYNQNYWYFRRLALNNRLTYGELVLRFGVELTV